MTLDMPGCQGVGLKKKRTVSLFHLDHFMLCWGIQKQQVIDHKVSPQG